MNEILPRAGGDNHEMSPTKGEKFRKTVEVDYNGSIVLGLQKTSAALLVAF
jgi:hypothetical protein